MLKFTVPLSFEQFTQHQLQLSLKIIAECSPKQSNKRPIGRPPKHLLLNDVIQDSNHHNNNNNNNNNTKNNSDDSLNNNSNKKHCARINWFKSPFIHDILAAYKICRSGYKTVQYLQRQFPKLDTEEYARFQLLSDSTVDGWFNSEHQLLPQHAALLNCNWHNPKGSGRHAILSKYPELVEKIKQTLMDMRKRNISVKVRQARIVFTAMIKLHQPELMDELRLSKSFLSNWCRSNLSWRYRKVTCNYDKLPINWEQQGRDMIDRIAVLVKRYKVNKNLIINFDQTGVHFIPKSNSTYETKGARHVSVMGVEDKRQITAIIASSLTGHLLPLQLIFGGSTDKCEPMKSHRIIKAQFHVTHSDNHWSTIDTMKEYMERIIQPYISHIINLYNLDRESRAIVLLDCWSVHKSKQFRDYVRRTHPNILLVYIPPNCTGQLQVADVALNYSFKHLIKIQYEEWVADEVMKQLQANESVKLATGAKIIKPLILEWCYNSWKKLENRQELIIKGWYKCMIDIRDPYDSTIQQTAFDKVLKQQLEAYDFVPKEDEEEDHKQYYNCITDSDSDEDELDPLKRRVYGERKSNRLRQQTITDSYTVRTDQLVFDSESEMES